MLKASAYLLLAGTSLVGLSTGWAQAAPASQGTENKGIEEIMVTAQRRSESITTVPLSISAISGEKLTNSGLTDFSSLPNFTPGLTVANGVGYTQMYIRGSGNQIFVGADPSVATFIDDVPRIYGSMINSMVNVERVEVLKGAQGGLYGRNATGGVINVITRQPSDTAAADVRISYGTRNTFRASGYVNVPLTDKIAINASMTRETHDPYIDNVGVKNPFTAANFPGYPDPALLAAELNENTTHPKGLANKDFVAFDGKVRMKLQDNFKITLQGDYNLKRDSEGNGWYNATPEAALAVLQAAFLPGSVFPNGLATRTTKWSAATATDSYVNIKDFGGSAKIDYNLSGVDLQSITSYRENKTFWTAEQTATGVPIVAPVINNQKWNFYQEFRALSNTEGPFQYIAGVTYLHNQVRGSSAISYLGGPATTAALSLDKVNSYSAYLQASYELTNGLKMTVSGRYVNEKNKTRFEGTPPEFASISASKFLPSATLSYNTDGGTLYVRYAKGFKTGGVNPTNKPSVFVNGKGSVFGPEEVDTYEAGYRAQLFQNKVQFTSAIFYNSIKGLQTTTNGDIYHSNIALAIINAGTARTYGAEADLTWQVVDALTIGANVGYLNAKYKHYTLEAAAQSGLTSFDFSNTTMMYSPKWQGGVTATLDQPINNNFDLVGNVIWSYISDQSLGKNPRGADPISQGYSLVNTRLGVRTADQRYEFALYAHNLFDQWYTTFAGTSSLGNNFTMGNRRIVGAEVRVKF